MRMKWKKITALALAGILLTSALAGCKKDGADSEGAKENGNEDTAMGLYLEEELALPEGIGAIDDMVLMEDGSLRVAARGEQGSMLIKSSDQGTTWESEELPAILSSEETQGMEVETYLSPQGEIALMGMSYNEETMEISNKFWLVQPDGTTSELIIQIPNEAEGDSIWEIGFARDGAFFATDYRKNAYELDKSTGAILKTYSGEGAGVGANVPVGDKQVLVTDQGIMMYDRVSGEKLPPDSVLSDQLKDTTKKAMAWSSNMAPALFAPGEEGGLFFCDSSGIYFHGDGSSVCEQLVDGNRSSLGNPNVGLLEMVYPGNDEFILAVVSGESHKLLKYTYSADTPSIPSVELNVYALEDNDYVRKVISDFQKENTDTLVNFQVGLTGEEGVTKEDALRTLNTDVLAGKGPDVLILDGMQVDSYVDKNLLMDMGSIVEEVKEADGIFENLAKAYEKDGKIYAVPAAVYVPLIAGGADAVAAGSSLDSLADRAETLKEQNPDVPVSSFWDAKRLLKEFSRADSANWTDEEGKISKEALSSFLEAAKRFYNTSKIPEEMESQIRNAGYSGEDNAGDIGRDSLAADITGLLTRSQQISLGNLGNITNFATLTSICNNDESALEYGLLNGSQKKSFLPDTILGISSETTEEETARLFVKAMLGSQTEGNKDYISINKKAYEAACVNPNPENGGNIGALAVSSDDGTYVDLDLKWPGQEDLDALTGIVESLEAPCINDAVVMDLVLEQGEKYLNNEQELDKTTESIMQKIELYQAE